MLSHLFNLRRGMRWHGSFYRVPSKYFTSGLITWKISLVWVVISTYAFMGLAIARVSNWSHNVQGLMRQMEMVLEISIRGTLLHIVKCGGRLFLGWSGDIDIPMVEHLMHTWQSSVPCYNALTMETVRPVNCFLVSFRTHAKSCRSTAWWPCV
jgi:hypothetical protein